MSSPSNPQASAQNKVNGAGAGAKGPGAGADAGESSSSSSLLSRVQDAFYHPFSSSALSQLPKPNKTSQRTKAKRADGVPDTDNGPATGPSGRPLVRDYHSINDPRMQAYMPAKKSTPVKVEAKVWFANERTWVSYINISVLMSTLSLAMWNASSDKATTWFAYSYGFISIAILIYGYAVFQKRLTMISARDAGQFDQLVGPLVICAALFIAISANFIFRYREL